MLSRAVTAGVILLVSLSTPFDRASDKTTPKDTIKVQVDKLLVAESRGIILLLKPEARDSKEESDPRVLPLVIGLEEGRSIGVAFHKMTVPRPLSHDLMKKIIEEYGGAIEYCVITRMEHDTFFAELHLTRNGRDLTVDCRPSDAIGLSMRSGTPILVRREVFEQLAVDPNKSGVPDKGPRA